MNSDLLKLLSELDGIAERVDKTNKQRMTMAILLKNLMQHPATTMELKSSIAATLMDMLDEHMIQEDGPLIKLINDGIDSVCEEAKERGVYDLRGQLNGIRKVVKQEIDERNERIKSGEAMLKSMNLDNFNLN